MGSSMNSGYIKTRNTVTYCDDVIVRQEILVPAMTSATWNCAIVVCHDICMYLEALVLTEFIIYFGKIVPTAHSIFISACNCSNNNFSLDICL
jgi:hypothetical protein